MRLPRFTTLQLLLAAALCGLVLGLATSVWRTAKHAQITHLEFSPSGKYLAAKYSGGSIQVWNVQGDRPRLAAKFPAKRFPREMRSLLMFAGDTRVLELVSRVENGTHRSLIRTYDLQTQQMKDVPMLPAAAWHRSAATRDTVVVAVHTVTATHLQLYDITSGRLRRTHRLYTSVVQLSVSPDGGCAAFSDRDGGLHVLDLGARGRLQTITHTTNVTSHAVEAGKLVTADWAVSGPWKTVTVFDLLNPGQFRTISTGVSPVHSVAFVNEGSQIAAVGFDALEIYDASNGEFVSRTDFDGYTPYQFLPEDSVPFASARLALAPEGRAMASLERGGITIRSLPDGAVRFRLTTDWRWLQILLFTAGFAGWAAVWGIVSTRNRRYRISILTSALGECPPTELKLCWGLMFLGGCAALTIPISLLFLWGPFLFPTMYFALLVGVMAVARGAARDTQGLGHVATLQSICFVACDPINLILGAMELNLLRRPSVQEFLRHANGGQADEQRKRWLFFL